MTNRNIILGVSGVFFLICFAIVGRFFFGGPEPEIGLSESEHESIFTRIIRTIGSAVAIPFEKETGKTYHVSLDGDDGMDGLTSGTAFSTIQKALEAAYPGDIIVLSDGVYRQGFVTVRNGEKDSPITIRGTAGAVVKGNDTTSRVIEIRHDYHHLVGFAVDGLDGDRESKKNYRDKLIYLQGQEEKSGVHGVRIVGMSIRNAGGECVRLRYYATQNEILDNLIENCGAYDFLFGDGGKNGEGVYIGTAPEQTDDGKNPTDGKDRSDGNIVRGNRIDTDGNECVDIKEGSSGNIVERNVCTGQKDPESAGLDSRGSDNFFIRNEVFGNVGAGIRLGGDKKTDGVGNSVIENDIHDNEGGGIKLQRGPQKLICGNRFSGNGKDDILGSEADDVENDDEC